MITKRFSGKEAGTYLEGWVWEERGEVEILAWVNGGGGKVTLPAKEALELGEQIATLAKKALSWRPKKK